MVCCTYLNDREFTAPVSDEVLQDLLRQVRTATGQDFRLQEVIIDKGAWWWKRRSSLYQLYVGIPWHDGRCVEFQVMNVYRGPEECTLPGLWDASVVSSYFYGVLNGMKRPPSIPADIGDRIIAEIIKQGMFSVNHPDPAESHVFVWSSGAPEQLHALVASAVNESKGGAK